MKNLGLPLIILACALTIAVAIVNGAATTTTMNLTIIQTPAPRRPILNIPAPNATASYTGANFQMTATEPPGGGTYVQYKQEVYYNEACTQVVQSNSQPSSQTGWNSMNASSVPYTSYSAGNATGTTGIYLMQTDLAISSTYYWGAQAYDPDGSGSWGTSTLTRVDNAWSVSPNQLKSAVYGHAAVTYNGYIYVTGGWTSTDGNTSSVLYAPISSDGSPGVWTTSPNKLPNTPYYHASVAYNGYIYTIGGYDFNVGAPTSSVSYAPINANGSPGVWTTSPNKLPGAIYLQPAAVYNGYIYTIGGNVGGGATSSVFYAPINSNGSPGVWTTSPNRLPSAIYDNSAVAYNGYIYAVGGTNNGSITGATSSVFYAQIIGSSTGPWYTNPYSLPTSTYLNSAAVYNSYIYVTGGSVGGNTPTSSVSYAPINTSSTGVWTTSPNKLPGAIYLQPAVANNGYVYGVGGTNNGVSSGATSSVFYSQINVQGDTADEGWVTNSTIGKLGDSPTIAYNRYIHTFGGTYDVATGLNITSTIFYAPINANGETGTWLKNPNSLPARRGEHVAVVYNGYVYIIGGCVSWNTANDWCGSVTSSVLYAQIDSSSTGQWYTNPSLPSDIYGHSAVAYNGYIYTIGGCSTISGGGCANIITSTNVLYAPINVSSTGAWQATTAMPTGTYNNAAVAWNGYLYVIGGCVSPGSSCGSATSTVFYAPLGSDGSVGAWSTTALPTSTFMLSAVAYNGYIYAIGGNTGGVITSSVFYTQILPLGVGTGTISSWLFAGAMSSVYYNRNSAVAYNGRIYLTGGYNPTTTVQHIGLYTSCTAFTVPYTNFAPTVSNVVINHGSTTIPLVANATTSIDINYTVNDNNGCSDIVNMTSTFYRTGVAGTCAVASPTTDNRNCYLRITNTTSSCISTTQYNVTDTVALYYFADSTNDPSSTYPTQHWEAYATVTDLTGASSTATSTDVDILILSAFEVSPSSTSYGTLYAGRNTSSTNQIEYVQNVGNSTTTLSLNGNAFTSGINSIATSSQHYATSSFTFGGSEQSLQGNATSVPGFSTIPAHVDTGPVVFGWKTTSPLPSALYQHSAVVYNGYIYTTGGSGGGLGAVYYAPVTSTSSVGIWRTNPNSLPVAAAFVDTSAVAYNGYIYTTGGYDTAKTSTVFYAQINSSSTGPWYINPYSLPTSTYRHSAVVYNSYIYVIGGVDTSTVYYAQIVGSSTGPWYTNPNSLPSALYQHSAVVYNGYIYTTGGCASLSCITANITSTVYYAQIVGSSTGPWQTNPNSLPSALYQHSAVVYNGYIYATGGLVAGSGTSTVLYTSLDNRPMYWGLNYPAGSPAGSYQSTVTYTANWAP